MVGLDVTFQNPSCFNASLFWFDLPEKIKRIMLWDISPVTDFREREFAQFIKRSNLLLIAKKNSSLVGMAWIEDITNGCDAGWIHFCFNTDMITQDESLQIGNLALEALAENGTYTTLVATLPNFYHHAINYCLALGFKPSLSINGAAFIAALNRSVPLQFLMFDLAGEKE